MIKILTMLSFLLLASCGGDSKFWDSSCNSEKDDVKSRLGTPEEVQNYSSSGYTSDSWWYWKKGIEYTFTYTTSCDVSTYTFTPIH